MKVLFINLCAIWSTVAVAEALRKDNPWGPEDEIGAANRITQESVIQATKLVKQGKTYRLGIIVDSSTPAFPPRIVSYTATQPFGITGIGSNQATFTDDILYAWLGTGSQIDGLGHAGIGPLLYNGFNRSEVVMTTGLTRLGLEKLPPLVSRGVILNMAAYFGKDIVDEGTPYTRRDIRRAAMQQGVEIRKGDVVLFYSGWLNLIDGDNPDLRRFISVEPGLGLSGARYLAEVGVLAVGADTWGVEVVPFEDATQFFKGHQILSTKNGIYTLENIDTRELVRDKVQEFMFVLGVTRIRGTSQMMINPTAIA